MIIVRKETIFHVEKDKQFSDFIILKQLQVFNRNIFFRKVNSKKKKDL